MVRLVIWDAIVPIVTSPKHHHAMIMAAPSNHFQNKSCKHSIGLISPSQICAKIVPKLGKSRDHDQNRISSDDGQETLAFNISGNSFHTPVAPFTNMV